MGCLSGVEQSVGHVWHGIRVGGWGSAKANRRGWAGALDAGRHRPPLPRVFDCPRLPGRSVREAAGVICRNAGRMGYDGGREESRCYGNEAPHCVRGDNLSSTESL